MGRFGQGWGAYAGPCSPAGDAILGALDKAGEVTEYTEICNASAAVAIVDRLAPDDRLFVTCDDEDKKSRPRLRLYQIGRGGPPIHDPKIPGDLLELDEDEDLEVDLEGAAEIEDLTYWIGSHSADGDGQPQPNRRRLFATRLSVSGGELTIEPIGKAYKRLIEDLDRDDDYKRFHLLEAGKKQSKADGALSIEGLAATSDRDLLIGFRNPIIDGQALIARLKNPRKTMEGERPDFGKPILLDLHGRGVRSIERLHDQFFIVAGRSDSVRDFQLYRWSGSADDAPQPISLAPPNPLSGLNPEAIFFDRDGAYILSDDGKDQPGQLECKQRNKAERRFRGIRIGLPALLGV